MSRSEKKHYCHDVTYSKSGLSHDRLLTSSFWTRRMCCVTETNGTVVASFHPQKMALPVVVKYNQHPNNYSMACYRSESRQSDVMSFPATVQHGEPVTCYVDVATWDPRLYLVVPNCQFHSSMTAGTTYQFIKDRFATVESFNCNRIFIFGHVLLYYKCDSRVKKTGFCAKSQI